MPPVLDVCRLVRVLLYSRITVRTRSDTFCMSHAHCGGECKPLLLSVTFPLHEDCMCMHVDKVRLAARGSALAILAFQATHEVAAMITLSISIGPGQDSTLLAFA